MARFIKVNAQYGGFGERPCLFLNCESVAAVSPQLADDGQGYVVQVFVDSPAGQYFGLPEVYSTFEEACGAAEAFAERVERCRD